MLPKQNKRGGVVMKDEQKSWEEVTSSNDELVLEGLGNLSQGDDLHVISSEEEFQELIRALNDEA